MLDGARDNWFRPSDVCVAPDGSLFVADWYDPGVGGHNQQDVDRGRIFRVAPPGIEVHGAEVRLQHGGGRAGGAEEPGAERAVPGVHGARRNRAKQAATALHEAYLKASDLAAARRG